MPRKKEKTSSEPTLAVSTLSDVIEHLISEVAIEKIIVVFDKPVPGEKLLDGKRLKPKRIFDMRFPHLEQLLAACEKLVYDYQSFLNTFLTNDKSEFTISQAEINQAIYRLYNEARSYDGNNRFMFLRNQVFFNYIKGQHHPFAYENLDLSPAQSELLKELFGIRRELFDELVNRTSLFLSILEYNIFKRSPIQLSNKGKTALVEFVLALETSSGYIIKKEQDYRKLRKAFSDFFGIESRQYTKLESSIKIRKSQIGIHLTNLAESINKTYQKTKK